MIGTQAVAAPVGAGAARTGSEPPPIAPGLDPFGFDEADDRATRQSSATAPPRSDTYDMFADGDLQPAAPPLPPRPSSMGQSGAVEDEEAQRSRSKRKKRKGKRRLSDEGSPLEPLRWFLGGLGGAVVGVILWVAVAAGLGVEIGWIASILGFSVGMGVRFGSGGSIGAGPGIIAVVIAMFAILVAKFVLVVVLFDRLAEDVGMGSNDVDPQFFATRDLADEIAMDREAQGRPIAWPPGVPGIDDAFEHDDYPDELWNEAEAAFEALTPEERQARLSFYSEASRENAKGVLVMVFFLASLFNLFNLLWFGLAGYAAYRTGCGE